MSFGAKEAREPRIQRERKPRVNLCGACGQAVGESELLCAECRTQPTPGTPDAYANIEDGDNRWAAH
jgi:hypothetical protein